MWKGEPQNVASKIKMTEVIDNNYMNNFRRLIRVCTVCLCPANIIPAFVFVDALRPSHKFFSHVRISCLPGLNR